MRAALGLLSARHGRQEPTDLLSVRSRPPARPPALERRPLFFFLFRSLNIDDEVTEAPMSSVFF